MPLNITQIHAICFDIDGTLRNTDDQYTIQIEKWLHYIGYLFIRGDSMSAARRLVMLMEEPGNLLISIPDRLGIDRPLTQFMDFLSSKLFKSNRNNEIIIPGVIDCLSYFQTKFPISVVSARGEKQSMSFLNHFELLPFFHCIVTGQTTPHTKPYPDPIIWAARQMNVSAEECLMVGDTTVDILAANAAGAQSVGVLSGFGEENELRQAGAGLILPSVAELIEIFK